MRTLDFGNSQKIAVFELSPSARTSFSNDMLMIR